MPVRAQDADNGTASTCRLPNTLRQFFGAQEGERGAWRGLIEIVATVPQRRSRGAGAERNHRATQLAPDRGREQTCVSEIGSLLSADAFDQNETFCRAPPRQAGFVFV